MVEYWFSTTTVKCSACAEVDAKPYRSATFWLSFHYHLNFKARVRKKVLPHLEAGGAVLECQHCGCGFVRLLLSLSAWVGKD